MPLLQAADVFMLMCTCFVFLSMVEFAVVNVIIRWAEKIEEKRAQEMREEDEEGVREAPPLIDNSRNDKASIGDSCARVGPQMMRMRIGRQMFWNSIGQCCLKMSLILQPFYRPRGRGQRRGGAEA